MMEVSFELQGRGPLSVRHWWRASRAQSFSAERRESTDEHSEALDGPEWVFFRAGSLGRAVSWVVDLIGPYFVEQT